MLAAAASEATGRLAAWAPADLLSMAEADVTKELVELATFEVPSLARGKAWQEPSAEITVTKVGSLSARQIRATATRMTLVVPVTGEPTLFGRSPNSFFDTLLDQQTFWSRAIGWNMAPGIPGIRGEIDHEGNALRLHCDDPKTADEASAYFERRLNRIELLLKWTRAKVQRHNQKVAEQLPALVAERRAKLLRDRDLQASIGFPIMKRPDVDNYSVPLKRKKTTLGRLATPSGRPNAHVPEPAIDDDDYEAVLAAPMRTRPPHQPGHAFISYVREDSHEVDKLQRTLEDAGVSVWRDTSSLWPGENWRAKIHGAISRDALVFIACFSSHSTARRQTYQNEELLLAIEQLRLRQPDDPWLIPVRFNDWMSRTSSWGLVGRSRRSTAPTSSGLIVSRQPDG